MGTRSYRYSVRSTASCSPPVSARSLERMDEGATCAHAVPISLAPSPAIGKDISDRAGDRINVSGDGDLSSAHSRPLLMRVAFA